MLRPQLCPNAALKRFLHNRFPLNYFFNCVSFWASHLCHELLHVLLSLKDKCSQIIERNVTLDVFCMPSITDIYLAKEREDQSIYLKTHLQETATEFVVLSPPASWAHRHCLQIDHGYPSATWGRCRCHENDCAVYPLSPSSCPEDSSDDSANLQKNIQQTKCEYKTKVLTFHMQYFAFFHFCHPFLSKYLLRMWKNWKIKHDPNFFYDGKFRRQWGLIYFLTCENFSWEFWTRCARTF